MKTLRVRFFFSLAALGILTACGGSSTSPGGGSTADFFAYRWQSNGTGGFTYADVTSSFPTGRVFVAASAANTAVPFGAFGNQFKSRAWIRRVHPFGVGFDDSSAVRSGQRGFDFGFS